MNQLTLLNILIIFEAILLLVLSLIVFSLKKQSSREKNVVKSDTTVLKEDFLPIIVHEMRSPLSIINGAADLLVKTTDSLSVEQIHTLLNQVKVSSTTLLDMVGSILDISKMESGKFELNKKMSNINSVLDDECSYFEPLAKIKEMSLECTSNVDIPDFSFDPDRIKQVLNNLISNAIKFSSEKDKVTISARKEGNKCVVEVCDIGVGVPEEEKQLLFQKFFQASNQGGRKGTGLGLFISKGIVEAHGGKIWVEDNEPKGTKMIFQIPINTN